MVFLDNLRILVKSRRSDNLKLILCKKRLHYIGCVHRTSVAAFSGSDKRVDLIYEQYDVRVGNRLVKHVLIRSSKSPCIWNRLPSNPYPCCRLSCLFIISGTSLFAILSARPSAIAVFPTPGSPTRQGLFFVRLTRICITLLISSSRPITGQSCRPWRLRSDSCRISRESCGLCFCPSRTSLRHLSDHYHLCPFHLRNRLRNHRLALSRSAHSFLIPLIKRFRWCRS